MYVWVVTDKDGKFLEVFTNDNNPKDRIKRSVKLTCSRSTPIEQIVDTTDLMVWENGIEARCISVMDKANHL